MRRLLVFTALFFCASLVSCQCAKQPDVGPVEGEKGGNQAMQVEMRTMRPVV